MLKHTYRFPHEPKWATGSAVLLRMAREGPHHDAHLRVRIGGWTTGRILEPFHVLPQSPGGFDPLVELKQAERPTNEWNELNVTCVERAIAVRINGVLVNQAHLGRSSNGYVGLAPQGCAVQFRNISLFPIRD